MRQIQGAVLFRIERINQGEIVKHLLNEAASEIESLRRRNALLEAQMEVVEIFRVALMGPRREGGMSPDVVWALRKKITELEAVTPA